MQTLWSILMILVGFFLLVSATLKSKFVIYQLLVARSRLLWGERVHTFHQVSGAVIIVLGLLWAFGRIWS